MVLVSRGALVLASALWLQSGGVVSSTQGFVDDDGQIFGDLNPPKNWDTSRPTNKRKPRTCNGVAEMVCEQEYMTCKLYAGPANDAETHCTCAAQFYGICLREAGCAARRYLDCVNEHIGNDCADMSVCGSNCVAGGNALDLSAARIIPVNNYAANFVRFSTCDLGVDQETFDKFGVVRMRRCKEPGPGVLPGESFKICPYWVPPSTFTAIAIEPNSTYMRVEYANYVATKAVNGGGGLTRSQNATLRASAPYIANVLRSPPAREYYGTEQLWPSSIDIEYSESNYCESNSECVGSYCNKRYVPHKCAPKAAKHFERNARQFMDHTYAKGQDETMNHVYEDDWKNDL